MGKTYDVIIELDEDGYYVGSVPLLPGCHTQARSIDDLLIRIKEAIGLYLKVKEEQKEDTKFLGIQRVEVNV
ncbi:MAG TPA: type II toxin-antitoxin system HicB family antitoxin [Methanofastidiosum sp.]|nr:type II toxin-antitoxin system HicB family antitoxin [Methanofastidiosum sp.]HNU61763.1 type II toxin-antitoxin system HicB family antitoxin [Methanofastidiosum sp.]